MENYENHERVTAAVFLEVFLQRYCENPFGTSGFAYWKTKKVAADGDVYIVDNTKDSRLYITKNRKLYSYISDDEALILHQEHSLATFDLINIHSRYSESLYQLQETHEFHRYRPLSYVGKIIDSEDHVPEGVGLRPIDPTSEQELAMVADVISRSSRSSMRPKTVASWIEEPVFDKRFWIAATDRKTNEVIGIGISTYDEDVRETDLDWFYVIPEYQHRGIGTALVKETLRRCMESSVTIRVAGMADGFYEKCGFKAQDEWYFIVRKGKVVSWWD